MNTLPTGWPTPAPQEATEKYPNNTLPILMLLWLIFIALFFLGALIYFAWRLARGHCPDCESRDTEIVWLKKRLANKEEITPAMVQQRETPSTNPYRANRVAISEEDLKNEVTVRTEDLERGITVIRGMKTQQPPSSSQSQRSDPFVLENAVPVNSRFSDDTLETLSIKSPELMRKRSEASMFRHGLGMEQNRSLAMHELTRPPSNIEEEYYEDPPLPFWKRTLARVGLKRKETEDLEERNHQPMMRTYTDEGRAPISEAIQRPFNPPRTYSHPGPAPAPPVPVPQRSDHHRPATPNPYAFNPRSAYFENTGDADSGRGSSDAVPKRYPQPARAEFITVGLDDQVSWEQEQQRAEELRNKRRTGGYGGMTPMVPPGMDGDEYYPMRV
ncbi:uncharacterized protein N0V89_006080 [Didymosphaeria variabile]|uniref:Uncharacterized protein n=1 Tax=Didymosphaeria variabile TaxID=1932322 RepID=A0A9W8XPE6_9PLEO|nr:uncharacterized protein N0V89_006080 [Didymosphaeria variabile]KAJ4354345.1 hypothetical protein N0V89_006080 [Didymosphaeria variabile]